MQKDPIVIVSVARTPQGKFLGELKNITSTKLGSIAIKSTLERAHLMPSDIHEVYMGCVLTAGLGQAPARQAALGAELPNSVPCTTINKMCASGMKAVMLAHDRLIANESSEILIAGGMESMSNAPYLLPKARTGYRIGHAETLDHMLWDGLEDAYEKGRHMGYFAELCAKQYGFTREEQDLYAIESLIRAQKAIRDKLFIEEMTSVVVSSSKEEKIVDTDEHPLAVKIEKIPYLLPAFVENGTVTAANSSSIADGAAALVLMRRSEAEKRGIKPLANIIGFSSHAKTPNQFTTAPVEAIAKLLKKLNWSIDQVDLFEINEAFAVVAMAAMHDLHIPREKLNVHGGGCALGHPIGATGARIIVTLVSALKHYHFKRGIAALCIGGGEATAIAIEAT